MGAETINGSDLDTAVNTAKKTVVVMFWAAWSGACRANMPTYESIAQSSGTVPFYKFDVDSDQATCLKFGVRAVPTFSLYKGGQLYGQVMGAQSMDRLRALVANA